MVKIAKNALKIKNIEEYNQFPIKAYIEQTKIVITNSKIISKIVAIIIIIVSIVGFCSIIIEI